MNIIFEQSRKGYIQSFNNFIYTGRFFNPVKSNVFLGDDYIYPTRKILVAFFHLVLKILGCVFCFCIFSLSLCA